MRQRRCGRRARGGGGGGEAGGETRAGRASRACGRKTKLGARGGGSRASLGAAAPQRWRPNRGGVTAPTPPPTSQYRAWLLGVTRAEAGPMGDGERAEEAGLLAVPAGARAPGGGRAVGWAPRPACLCAGPGRGPGPRRAGPGGGVGGSPGAPVITGVTVCLFSHLRLGFLSRGGNRSGFEQCAEGLWKFC